MNLKSTFFFLALTIASVQRIYAQSLQKVHTFEYYMPNFEQFTSRFRIGDGLLVKYSSGGGMGTGKSTIILVNNKGKVINDFKGRGVVVKGNTAYDLSLEKEKFVLKQHSFEDGTITGTFQSNTTINALIKASGMEMKKDFSFSLSNFQVIDEDNLLIKIYGSQDNKYFNMLFTWNIKTNEAKAIAPQAYPELKKESSLEQFEETEWGYLRNTNDQVYYYKKVYYFDKNAKKNGVVRFHIARYDFDGRLTGYYGLETNEPGDKLMKEYGTSNSSSQIITYAEDIYTIAFTEKDDKPSAWVKKFDLNGKETGRQVYPLEKNSLYAIEHASENDFSATHEGLQFKSVYTKYSIDLLLDYNTLEQITAPAATKETAHLMEAISMELSSDKDLKLVNPSKDIIAGQNVHFVFLKGKGKTYHIYLYHK